MADEFERIAAIARALGDRGAIGDDAAVLGDLVITVDAQVEDVHFRRAWLTLEDLGYRATVAAASDVFAMGATPTAAVCAWTLAGELDEAEIARGQRAACEAIGMAMVGGNISRGPVLSLTTTVIGRVERPILRSGARVGDIVGLYGAVGDAAVGLAALRAGQTSGRAIDVWRRPPVHRVSLGDAHAAIDVSDGLAQDVEHLARASGVAVVLGEVSISADLVPVAHSLGLDPVTTALAGGEDYALVATFSSLPPGFTAIGRVEAGEGVWLERDGQRVAPPRGFRH